MLSTRSLLLSLATASLLFAQGSREGGPSRPAVGDKAPAFRLNDHTGRAVRVAPPKDGEEGRWTVMAFFPKAATPG